MDELGRLLLLIGCVGVAITALGVVSGWWMEETRRIRRGLKRMLGAEPQALLIAPGQGKGAGFDFDGERLAVAWDGGGWGLVYRFAELVGAELILDGRVGARAHRGEPRRALDALEGAERQVRLRLLFADARWPDFDLDLWLAGSRGKAGAAQAVVEANRWLARVDAILRQSPAPVAARRTPAPEPEILDEDDDPPF